MTAARAVLGTLGPTAHRFSGVALTVLLAAGAGLFGLALMFVSAQAGEAAPLVALAIPLFPIIALVIIARPFVGIIVVFASIPFGSVGISVGPATLNAVEIAVLIVGSLIILRRLAIGQAPLPWSPLLAFPLALLAWTLVALYSAIDETLAVKQVASLIGGYLFASAAVAACRNTDDVRRILGAVVAAAMILSVIALSAGSQLDASYGGAQVEGRLTGAFEHPNQLGSFTAIAIALAIALAVGARTPRGRLVSGFAPLVLLPALALSLSRGAWIGMVVAVLFLFFALKGARNLLIAFSIPVAILGVIIWSAQPDRPELKIVGERAKALTKRSPYDGRDEIWAAAIQRIKDDPLTGTGPGTFPLAAVRADSPASSVAPYHAHNLYLNWAAETGVPAALIILAFSLALGLTTSRANRGALARGDPRDRAVTLGIAAALISIAAQGMFDYVLGNPVLHVTAWALVGCLVVMMRENPLGRRSARASALGLPATVR